MGKINELHMKEDQAIKRLSELCQENKLVLGIDVVVGDIFAHVSYEHGQAIKSEIIKKITNLPFKLSFVSITNDKRPVIYFSLDRTRL
jgi:hypothetical protein